MDGEHWVMVAIAILGIIASVHFYVLGRRDEARWWARNSKSKRDDAQ